MNRNQEVASNYGTKCPVCHGTGWALITRSDEYDSKHTVGIPCQHCRGARRSQENTNVPTQFYESDIHKFKFVRRRKRAVLVEQDSRKRKDVFELLYWSVGHAEI